jgi:protein-disulfide isomerase
VPCRSDIIAPYPGGRDDLRPRRNAQRSCHRHRPIAQLRLDDEAERLGKPGAREDAVSGVGGARSTPDPGTVLLRRLRAEADVRSYLAPAVGPRVRVEEDGPTFGASDADVTLVVFSDLMCPSCRALHPALKELVNTDRRVRVVFKHMPLVDIHPQAQLAAEAAWCAEAQGKFWLLLDQAMASKGRVDAEAVGGWATAAGLDIQRFRGCLGAPSSAAAVAHDVGEGQGIGVDSTPVILVNGRVLVGNVGVDALRRVIQRERAQGLAPADGAARDRSARD